MLKPRPVAFWWPPSIPWKSRLKPMSPLYSRQFLINSRKIPLWTLIICSFPTIHLEKPECRKTQRFYWSAFVKAETMLLCFIPARKRYPRFSEGLHFASSFSCLFYLNWFILFHKQYPPFTSWLKEALSVLWLIKDTSFLLAYTRFGYNSILHQ